MFGSKKPAVFVDQQVETVIGKGTQIQGSITASGIRIDGQLDGDLTSSGDVLVGDSGVLNAEIKARNAVIAGMVKGNVEVAGKLELMPTAKLCGDIKVGMLIIGEGAVFKGACEMHQESGNFNNNEA
ncbi:MAG: polymer-forming cytoskeletal protein [Pelosinus sp.]|nr:polymer-forming cytoskeletal protein [Pelosinus sp.]